MLSLLLNPKNMLIAFLALALGATWLSYDLQKHKAMKYEAALSLSEATVETQKKDIVGWASEMSAANSIIESLKANLTAIKRSLAEMQAIKDEANKLRKRIIELQDRPLSCPELESKYEQISIDAGVWWNSGGVRGKVRRPEPDSPAGDPSTVKILPPTPKTGDEGQGPKVN